MGCYEVSNKKRKENKIIEATSKIFLRDIKSKYIIQQIFDNLQKNKLLRIVQYNKKTQSILNLNMNDYKDYYEKVEIEITPIEKISFKYYDNHYFINGVGDEKNYHVYFNDCNEEIKRRYLIENDIVSKIKVIIDYEVNSFFKLFQNCDINKSIKFKKFYRNNITDMSYMFSFCPSLEELNISKFNTDNVTDMSYMFLESRLKNITLSNFKTNNVTNMEGIFYNCSSLKELTLSNFNTNNVTNMESMFYNCLSLEKLNISNFNANNVFRTCNMFRGCSSLKELNLSNFHTNKLNYTRNMFFGCSSLKKLNLSNFNISKVTNVSFMFYNCSSLKELIISSNFKPKIPPLL